MAAAAAEAAQKKRKRSGEVTESLDRIEVGDSQEMVTADIDTDDVKQPSRVIGRRQSEARNTMHFVSHESGQIHLQEIEFDANKLRGDGHDPIAPALYGLNKWEKIPPLSIVTGKNGSGKSQLLRYIKKYYETELRQYSAKNDNPADHSFKNRASSPSILTFSGSVDGNVHVYERMNTGTNNHLEQSVDVCYNYFIHPETFNEKMAASSHGQAYKHFCAQNTVPDKQKIRQFIMNWDIVHTSLQHSNSITMLNAMIEKYYSLRSESIAHFAKISNLFSDFLKFYSPTFVANASSSSAIGTDIGSLLALSDRDRLDLIEKRTDEMLGQPPWVKMNKILQKYNFNLSLDREAVSDGSQTFAITFRRRINDEFVTIPTTSLSSGEQLLLELFGWLFYMELPNDFGVNIMSPRSIQLILMDEPDRHLDPTSCSTFMSILRNEIVEHRKIQVIMTTHRTDTVMLTPDHSLFVIDGEDGNKFIHSVQRLHALFKMSHNQRELTNLRIKVFVEAYSDTQFYDAILGRLLQLIERRSELSLIDGIELPRLSRRYIPEFHSVAQTKEASGGGKQQVLQAVKRGFWFYETKASKQKSNTSKSVQSDRIDPAFFLPFGLIDLDSHNESYVSKVLKGDDDVIRSRIMILKRYSYENFLFDPFILSCVIQNLPQGQLHDSKIRETLQRVYDSILNSDQNLVDLKAQLAVYYDLLLQQLFQFFVKAEVYKGLLDPVRDSLTDELKDILNSNKNIKLATHPSEAQAQLRAVLLQTRPITVFLPNGSALHVPYPLILINLKGHVLADVILHLLNPGTVLTNDRIDQDSLIDALVNSVDVCLPSDLIDTFYYLSTELRKQGNSILNKEKNSGNEKVARIPCKSSIRDIIPAYGITPGVASMQLESNE